MIDNTSNALKKPSEAELSKGKAWAFLAALLVWGYLLAVWFPLPYLGIRLTLFALPAMGIFYAYLRTSGKVPPRVSYVYLGAALLLAFSFGLFENSGISMPLFLVLICLVVCWLLHAAEDRPLSSRDISDSLSLLAVKPFMNVKEKSALFSVKEQSRSQTKYVIIGVVITIPVFMVALVLLAFADENFNAVVSKVFGAFSEDLGTVVARLIAACVIAAYLLSMLISASRPAKKGEVRPLPQANGTVMSILIGALSALYAAFVAIQIMSVAGVFADTHRTAAFYSGYARDGFFELCQVVVLNLAVFLVAHIFRRTVTKSMRGLLTGLGVLTQALVVTAIMKMGLYMNHFGLTLLRVQTMWFMASLLIVFGVLIALQWKRFKGFQVIALLAVCSILAASFANIGGIVAGTNVKRYLAGSLSTIDAKQYRQFPYEAAPHLIHLYQETTDLEAKNAAMDFLEWLYEKEKPGWTNRSVQELMAEDALAAFFGQQASATDSTSTR